MFDRLKSLFIIEEEGPKKPAATASKPEVEKDIPTPVNQSMPSQTRPSGGGKITSKFTNILFGAMEKNNQEGFDYLEFKQSLRNLAKMPMDEATRFKSAFAMAQTMQVTPKYLLDSAKFYLQILDGEKNKFQQAVENQEATQIGDREERLQQLDAMIKEKKEMIEQLNKDIQQAQQQQAEIKKELTEASEKVLVTKNDFFASYQSLVGQIQKDIENMERYLK